jgi:hypothetical protein
MFAASRGIPAAEAFCFQIHKAMDINPQAALQEVVQGVRAGGLPEHRIQQLLGCADSGLTIPSNIKMFPQNDARNPLSMADDLQNSDLEDFDGLDYDSDAQDDLRPPRQQQPATLTDDMVRSVTEKDLGALYDLVANDPECLKYQDREGNTLLLIAARRGHYDAMEMLLDQASVDASICNYNQESALHLISHFSNEQIQSLVPRLIAKKADPHHEALPLQYGNSFLNFSAKIRCCAILRAILSDNLVLLSCLLEVAHRGHDSIRCQICGGGSRLKRIVAIALSTFRSKALGIMLEHIKAHKDGEKVGFSEIKVWSNRKLVPLWKLPFQSVIIKTVDLPESFFRAISYGDNHIGALQSTISFLLENVSNDSNQLYDMLREAVAVNSLDAVNLILEEAQRRQLQPSWWVITSKKAFPKSPLVLAIKYGIQAVFERLWDSNRNLFQEFIQISDECEPSQIARLFPDAPSSCARSRTVNLAQICLSLAVTASHQDQYFL